MDLEQRYQRKNRPHIFQIRCEISYLTQGQASVATYYAKLKSLLNELVSYRPVCTCKQCSCGGMKKIYEYFQTEHVMVFLMGLNESSNQIRTQLLLMEHEPSVARAFSLVAQEVVQQNSTSIMNAPSVSATAFLAKSSYEGRSSSVSVKKRERPICTHCGLQGHTVDRCYKLHGFPSGYHSHKTNIQNLETKIESQGLSALNTRQCQDFLVLLQSHISKGEEEYNVAPNSAHVARACSSSFKSSIFPNTLGFLTLGLLQIFVVLKIYLLISSH